MNAGIDPTRLYTVLTRTGLQTKDPVLYQLLYNLIGTLVKLTADSAADANGGGGGGGTVENITNIIQILESGISGTDGMPGPPGATGATGPQGPAGSGSGESIAIFGMDGKDGDTGYILLNPTSSSSPASTYDSVLTNGDPLTPEIIFDSFGDVIMVTGLPL